MIRKFLKRYVRFSYWELESKYMDKDKKKVLRTKNILSIPGIANRSGGKVSYGEWAHVIGLFQGLMYNVLDKHEDNIVLDIGCGSGLLAMSSEPFVGGQGKYIGLDVKKSNIDFCNEHYSNPNVTFEHFDINNKRYATEQDVTFETWPIADNSVDLVTALSVWTHMDENDAIFYMKEVYRVLKPKGKAIISFFIIDENYRNTLDSRTHAVGKFHGTSQQRWIFDQKAYNSEHWFCPNWVKVPEDAIAVDEVGLDMILKPSSLNLKEKLPGNWKEKPGFYFQDVLILEKP